MSYANLIMYGAVIPSYDKKDKKDKKDEGKKPVNTQKVIKADDPANKEEVRKFFENCD